MNSNQRVINFALDTKWVDLPGEAQHQSKRALLDNLGVLIAGGRLLGLNPEQLGHAMGVAEYFAPIAPMMKGIDVVAMTKDSISWGAMVAMSSILLAAKGFTGINPIFDDGSGPELTGKLGSDWLIMDLYHKPYACCYWVQAPIAGALALIKEHGLTPVQIARITVYSFREAVRLLCDAPRDTEEAQYNLAYGLACAVFKGKLGPSEVSPPAIFDPQTLEFMDRIKPVEDPEIQKEFPARRQARVEIATSDGRVFDSGIVDAPWGTPATRPTDQDLIDKFRAVAGPILGDTRVQELQDMIWNLEHEPVAARLVDLASVRGA